MNRRIFIFIIAFASFLGSAATAMGSLTERDQQLRGYVDASQDANLPYALPRLGVNAELTQYPVDDLNKQFDLMAAAHIYWIRQMVRWDAIEPQQGEYQWNEWDSIVEKLQSYPNLHLIAVLVNTPEWARPNRPTQTITTPPDNPTDFADFAQAFAGRYGQTIDYYQIWDEPNLTAAWGNLEPRAADYISLLAAAYDAIHAVDSSATVISAALAPTTETGPKNISDILYLQDMYALGVKSYMDAAAAKPYGFSLSPQDRTVSADTLNFSRIIALREVMLRNCDGGKSLWASEWGWNSLPDNWTGKPSIWGSVTAGDQAQFTLDALNRVEREWPWLAGMTLRAWHPDAPDDDPQWGFALIDQNNTPTPLWQVLANRSQITTAQNGLFPAANPYTRYSGVWKFGTLGADIGWVQDSQFDFDFSGSAVSLLLRQDNYTAYLYPTIDGQQANAVPQDPSGNAYLILTSGSHLPETNLIPVGAHLQAGNHTLHVIADRGWDHWAIAGFGVSSGNLAEPYNQQIYVAIFTTLVALLTCVVIGWRIAWTSRLKSINTIIRRLNTVAQLVLGIAASLALLAGMLLTWGDNVPNILRRDPLPLGLALATVGLIKLQPGLIITVVAAIVLFIIFFNRIEIGLTLTIFWAPFFLFPVELYSLFFPVAEILIVITTAAWLLRLFVEWGQWWEDPTKQLQFSTLRHKTTLLDYSVILWVAIGFVSLLWAVYRKEAVTELRVMLVEPALFYAIFRTSRLDRSAILRIVDGLLIAGFVVSIIGLWQFAHGEAVITAEGGAQRLASVYGSPNNVGLFLGRCLPFIFAFLLVSGIDLKRRIIAAVALLVMGTALVLSQSVGALFVGVPAAFIAVALLALRRRARLVLMGFVLVAIVTFIVALQFPRFARVLDFTSGTNLYRIRAWHSTLNIIHDHPITGLGLDQFLYAFRGHYIMPDAWQEPNLSHPHNIVLDFWVRLGIAGVGILILFQIAFWQRMRRLYSFYRNGDPLDFALTIGVIGSMVNLVSHGLIDNSVYVQDLAYVFVLLLALAAQHSNGRAIDEALI